MKNFRKSHAFVLTALVLFGYVAIAPAQLNTTANIKATKHNLSSSGTGSVKATNEDQICVFCHTPHAANVTAPSPLWNRKIGGDAADGNTYIAAYKPYQSNSLDAAGTTIDPVTGDKIVPPPGGASKLCLSCHDGTLALGTVGVLDGKSNPATVTGLTGTMPTGLGATTGFTRNLGVDLRNDHPISFTFDSNLATSDGEFRSPPYTASSTLVVGQRSSGVKPMLPLDHEGKVQCTSCHDPHLQASKFLRLNRLQKVAPAGGDFIAANDQICLGCHNKLGTTWSNSAHAIDTVADEAYADLAADRREFARGTKVWEAACLNCHDTHSVQGSRRLLREGVDTTVTGADAGAYQGGSTASNPATVSAIEQTCYQCHQGTATKAIGTASGSTVPNIKSEFDLATHMPIVTSAQGTSGNTTERHNISNADFMETPAQLGAGDHSNRHVECTDCHNPHRVRRNSKFYGLPGDANSAKRTHDVGGTDGNIASGVLRGIWGVEPTYGSFGSNWPTAPTYEVKKGDPGTSVGTSVGATYLTREYQLCLKCHSDYGGSAGGNMPSLGYSGGTLSSTNGMTRYTNVAAEFAVNAGLTPTTGTDQGEYGEGTVSPEDGTAIEPSGSYPADTDPGTSMTDAAGTQNHRSWHPVMKPTGRTYDERRISDTTNPNFRTPFKEAVGTQTMQCSDCHGNPAGWTQNTGPNSNTQGPHGSTQNFLLKGAWSTSTTIGGSTSTDGVCFNCHNPRAWGCDASKGTCSGDGQHTNDGTNISTTSGFNNPGTNNQGGHGNAHNGKSCMRCHIAVPHGWKNKAFLINLNCVGPEGASGGDCVTVTGAGISSTGAVTRAPYYISSYLRVAVWRASGNWTESSCGVAAGGLKAAGKDWMTDGNAC